MNRPRYDNRPIGSIAVLARILGTTPRHINYLARKSNAYYYPGKKIVKPDGTIRQTYGASKPLRTIQLRILRRILYKVQFPSFLLGGIKGGGHSKNALLHSGKKALIGEDVENFFHSVTVRDVERIFKYFFRFPPDVARALTLLTTYNGCLPQGACTSTYIANLVFWDKESVLELRLRKKGIKYTRYVDDCNASSESDAATKLAEWAKSKIRGLYATKNLKGKDTKSVKVARSGRMSIHNLTINGPAPTLSRQRQAELKMEVRRLQELQESQPDAPETAKQVASLRGKLQDWNRFQPKKAQRQLNRLSNLKSVIRSEKTECDTASDSNLEVE